MMDEPYMLSYFDGVETERMVNRATKETMRREQSPTTDGSETRLERYIQNLSTGGPGVTFMQRYGPSRKSQRQRFSKMALPIICGSDNDGAARFWIGNKCYISRRGYPFWNEHLD